VISKYYYLYSKNTYCKKKACDEVEIVDQ